MRSRTFPLLSRPRRSGFTLVELMTVIIIISLLAAIGLLKYMDLRNTARSAQVLGDFRSVMVAAYNYYADFNDWPPDAGAGTVPAPLAPYLPPSTQFTRSEYTLDYDNLGLGGSGYMIGVTVTSSNDALIERLIRNLGGKANFFVAGSSLTYIIVGSDGQS